VPYPRRGRYVSSRHGQVPGETGETGRAKCPSGALGQGDSKCRPGGDGVPRSWAGITFIM